MQAGAVTESRKHTHSEKGTPYSIEPNPKNVLRIIFVSGTVYLYDVFVLFLDAVETV